MSNEDIQKELIKQGHQNLEHHNKYFKFGQNTTVLLNEISHEVHAIKQGQSKFNLIMMAIVLSVGIVLGIEMRLWIPIIDDVTDAVQIAKQLTSKG